MRERDRERQRERKRRSSEMNKKRKKETKKKRKKSSNFKLEGWLPITELPASFSAVTVNCVTKETGSGRALTPLLFVVK